MKIKSQKQRQIATISKQKKVDEIPDWNEDDDNKIMQMLRRLVCPHKTPVSA